MAGAAIGVRSPHSSARPATAGPDGCRSAASWAAQTHAASQSAPRLWRPIYLGRPVGPSLAGDQCSAVSPVAMAIRAIRLAMRAMRENPKYFNYTKTSDMQIFYINQRIMFTCRGI